MRSGDSGMAVFGVDETDANKAIKEQLQLSVNERVGSLEEALKMRCNPLKIDEEQLRQQITM